MTDPRTSREKPQFDSEWLAERAAQYCWCGCNCVSTDGTCNHCGKKKLP